MRVLAIGDIHGRNYWNTIPFVDFDRVIFLGDYLDSARLSNEEIIGNLERLVALQSEYENIDFLIGNHDLQYLLGYEMSGYRQSYEDEAMDLLLTLRWKFAREIDSVLYTHAGLLREFYSLLPKKFKTYEKTLNELREDHWELLIETVGAARGGEAAAGSFIWCDFSELESEEDPLPINQVFGHSAPDGGKVIVKNGHWKMCIDVFNKFRHAFEIIDGKLPAIYHLTKDERNDR